MDLGELSVVRKAAETDLADVPQIDHVVCAAGIMAPPFGRTTDGLELQLGINYLANFLLVKLLLPKVQAAGPSSSIIIVSSSAIRRAKIDFDNINFSVRFPDIFDEQNLTRLSAQDETKYEPMGAYGQSNVARVMFAKKLAAKVKSKGIRVYSIDPGGTLAP